MTERCVVTGGAGVIGAELVARLVNRGDSVRVIDLLEPPTNMPSAVDYLQGDLVEFGPEALSSFDPTVVFHLAATFERSEEAPEFWQENSHHNVLASAVTLQGALNAPRLRRYVFASSYLIYDPDLYLSDEPASDVTTLFESSRIAPRNVCGAAKLLHEKEVELATLDPNATFSSVSARIYRVYGPSSRDVISRWVRACVKDEPIKLFGDESRFDYVYSADVAEGLIRLADTKATGVVNLATGRARSVREVVACLQTHFPSLRVEGMEPAQRYEASQASTARLSEITGWTPTTELERGIGELVKHERDNLERGTVSLRVIPPRSLNVLVTSLSSKAHVPRAVRRAHAALNVSGDVWGGDVDEQATARSEIDRFWKMPPLHALPISQLREFCRRHEIGLVIPTRDGELEYFATHREVLRSDGVFVPVGDVRSVQLVNDKLRFAQRLRAEGLPAIPTSEDLNDLEAERLVVKPRYGAGSAAIAIDVDRESAEAQADQLDHPVFQPFVEGTEYSIDLYVDDDGDVVGVVPRARSRVQHGESQITSIVNDEELSEIAVRCAQLANIRGHAVIQVIRSDSGVFVLECNSRVGGASSAAWFGGLRSVDAMVREALDEKPVARRRPRAPLTMTRTPVDRLSWR